MNGVAIKAPAPAIIPLIDGILYSSLSEKKPPATEAVKPPPITVTAFIIAYWETWSGYLCSKKVEPAKPSVYPAANLKKAAMTKYTKHLFLNKITVFCLKLKVASLKNKESLSLSSAVSTK